MNLEMNETKKAPSLEKRGQGGVAYVVVLKRSTDQMPPAEAPLLQSCGPGHLNTVARFAVQGSPGPFCPPPRGTLCLLRAKWTPGGCSEMFFPPRLRQRAQQGSEGRLSGFQPLLCAFGSLNLSEPRSSYLHSESKNYLSGLCEGCTDDSVKRSAQCSAYSRHSVRFGRDWSHIFCEFLAGCLPFHAPHLAARPRTVVSAGH